MLIIANRLMSRVSNDHDPHILCFANNIDPLLSKRILMLLPRMLPHHTLLPDIQSGFLLVCLGWPCCGSHISDVIRLLGEKWRSLGDAEKRPFEAMADDDRDRYEKECNQGQHRSYLSFNRSRNTNICVCLLV
jgi:hypothetical protein